MKIIDKFRSKERVDIVTTGGKKISIEENTVAVELDCKVKVYFTGGAASYYQFLQNPNYYQKDEIKFVNILRDPNAIVDTVDDLIYEGSRIYSILILNNTIAFLMLDDGEEE